MFHETTQLFRWLFRLWKILGWMSLNCVNSSKMMLMWVWRLSLCKLNSCDSKCPNITFLTVNRLWQRFRAHPVRTTNSTMNRLIDTFLITFKQCNPKISNFHIPIKKKQVCCLYVPMNNTFFMKIFQSLKNWTKNGRYLFLIKSCFLIPHNIS